MKAKELAALLLQNPELDVWFDPDIPIGEGGVPCQNVKKTYASSAGLDGDEIDDEFLYIDDLTEVELKQKIAEGYYYDPDDTECISKEIILLNNF